jgi:proteasome lid subunit RPN8/RPN11
MEKISMSADLYQQMVSSLQVVYPEEGCGILAGKENIVESVLPVENELHAHDRFRMKAEGQLKVFLELDRSKLEMIGIYHSHPHGPAVPSETDVRENYYPDAAYLICSKQKNGWTTRAYRFENSRFSPIHFIVDPT